MTQLIIPPGDDKLVSLLGKSLPSAAHRDVSYQLEYCLGAGGMSVAIKSVRSAPDGDTMVVMKLVQPAFLMNRPEFARMVVDKEATALLRLNGRVPSTPFVVKLIDAGVVSLVIKNLCEVELPWLALEYVHGGPNGTTLTERVKNCIRWSHYAFDTERAMRVLECVAEGVGAVHEMGVVHRDLKPDNILCCGFGDDELFKVTDFGIARPPNMAQTFGGIAIGTPGYAAPEQIDGRTKLIGPWTDVFSLASLMFFVLTGEDYFDTTNAIMSLAAIGSKQRRSILTAQGLDPEIRARVDLCQEIDSVLARATSAKPEERPSAARRLSAELMPLLREDSRRGALSNRVLQATLAVSSAQPDNTEHLYRNWSIRHNGRQDMIVRSVAWASDGTCLVGSTLGLVFWDGTQWHEVKVTGLAEQEIHFVTTIGPGRWLLGGDGGNIVEMIGRDVRKVYELGAQSGVVTMASGDPSDLAVFVVQTPNSPPSLQAIAGRRWVRPFVMHGVSVVTSLVRLADARWLVAGRTEQGVGYAGVFDPLLFDVQPLGVPIAKSFLSAAGSHQREAAVIGGTGGLITWIENQTVSFEQVPTEDSLSTVAMDITLEAWAATPGKLWVRDVNSKNRWRSVWTKPDWPVPFVSLHCNTGQVVAIAADGGIVEGRSNAGW